jgi:hypothetical protein
MASRSAAFTANPTTTTLSEFRNAWKDAYAEWQKNELFEFGPADKYTLRNFFNIYPTNVNGILSNINDPSVSLELPASYDRQGFPALDYLLNGVATGDVAVVAYYTGTDGPKRLAYITRITSRMGMLLDNVIAEWQTYRDTFISKTGLDIGSSMGLVVNAYVLYYERFIRSGKIGIPSGSTVAGPTTPYPEKVEAYYQKNISRTLAKNGHSAAIDFFNGKSVTSAIEGPSFKTYLDGLGANDASTGTPLSTIINTEFTSVNSKLELLNEDFSYQVQTNNEAMAAVFANMQKVVRILKVDMTSAMSITITYTDNDGD